MEKYHKYITLYRAMLIAFLMPGIVLCCIGGQARNIFIMVYAVFMGLTFLVEVLLFAFQFTRRENFWAELLLLLLLIAFGLMLWK